MSDEENKIASPSEADPEFSLTEDSIPSNVQDWLLSNIVALSNAFGIEFGITLNVSGQTVSGTLISGKNYLKEMSELFTKRIDPESSGKNFDDVMSNFFSGWIPVYEDDDEIKKNPFAHPPAYIHLRNAQTVMGGGTVIPTKGGVLWRGRLAAVSGFNLGSINVGR